MADKMHSNDGLVIHLDLGGLAALMKAVEAAMATGRGRLEPGSGVIAVRNNRDSHQFRKQAHAGQDAFG
jgi:hypothetical protein